MEKIVKKDPVAVSMMTITVLMFLSIVVLLVNASSNLTLIA